MYRKLVYAAVLLIPLLYVGLVVLLPAEGPSRGCQASQSDGEVEKVGFCTEVSATVKRQYYFGVIRMKSRVMGLNVDPVSRLMPALTALMLSAIYRFY